MASQKTNPFAFFARAVEGHIVARYRPGPGPYDHIGVTIRPLGPPDDKGNRPVLPTKWDTETVFAFTIAEVAQFGHLYRRAVAEGGLKEATEKEYLEWVDQQARRAAAAEMFFARGRKRYAGELHAAFGEGKIELLTDAELLTWVRAAEIDIHAVGAELVEEARIEAETQKAEEARIAKDDQGDRKPAPELAAKKPPPVKQPAPGKPGKESDQ